jgi:malonyl-CoA/methylmalonyl-CoA synthetase
MPVRDSNLFAHFQTHIDARPDKELLVTARGESWQYADVERLSAGIANYLNEIGVKPGDRVTAQVEKSPQALCLYLACLRGGFVFHPLNPAYQPAELAYFLSDAEPAVAVCDPAKEASFRGLCDDAGVRQLVTLGADGRGSLAEQAHDMDSEFVPVPRNSDDLAALLYSSGTTGVPKGIMLSHGNLYSNTATLVEAWGFTQGDRLLHTLPIFHVHGLFVAIGCVLLSGADMRWLPAYDAEQVVKFLPECTVMMGVPTYYTRLLAREDFSAETCRTVRVFISGSAPLLDETFVDFEARTGHRILERYGMTETNMNTSNPLSGLRKPGTVGPPLPGVEVRVAGDDGEILPENQTGNLQVRGPNVFTGYWKLPEKTAEDFTDDGYFNTGDQGRIDGDGYVSIVGRARDMVITGGLNVYPKEVELFIDDLPGVRESAVIGVPHADFGEAVVAIVVPEGDSPVSEKSIRRVAEDDLANYKVPKRVVFVDELPRNTMAKVQKNTLREKYRDLFSR